MKKKSFLIPELNGIVLFQNKKWSIELIQNKHGHKELAITDGWLVTYASVTDRLRYDNPYMLPEYIKNKCESFGNLTISN